MKNLYIMELLLLYRLKFKRLIFNLNLLNSVYMHFFILQYISIKFINWFFFNKIITFDSKVIPNKIININYLNLIKIKRIKFFYTYWYKFKKFNKRRLYGLRFCTSVYSKCIFKTCNIPIKHPNKYINKIKKKILKSYKLIKIKKLLYKNNDLNKKKLWKINKLLYKNYKSFGRNISLLNKKKKILKHKCRFKYKCPLNWQDNSKKKLWKKKKGYNNVFHIKILLKRRNLFLTLINDKGKTLFKLNLGSCGFKKRKKFTGFAIEHTTCKFFIKVKEILKSISKSYQNLYLNVYTKNLFKFWCYRFVKKGIRKSFLHYRFKNLQIRKVKHYMHSTHSKGLRLKKQRRV